jgi:hypothetical protein
MTPDKDALALWLDQQQQGAPLGTKPPPEIHLHQHHYYGPQQPLAQPREHRYSRARAATVVGPRLALLYVFVGAISLAVVFAALGAVIDSLNRPSVQYVQPQQGGW